MATLSLRQIRGMKSQLTAAINQSDDGAYATMDIKTARNLQEICDQLIALKSAKTD